MTSIRRPGSVSDRLHAPESSSLIETEITNLVASVLESIFVSWRCRHSVMLAEGILETFPKLLSEDASRCHFPVRVAAQPVASVQLRETLLCCESEFPSVSSSKVRRGRSPSFWKGSVVRCSGKLYENFIHLLEFGANMS